MKKCIPAALIAAALVLPAHAQQQQKADEHAGHHPAAGQSEAADLTDGEVRRVDKGARKITLRHAEIKSLDMPAMTMVFQVSDPAMLDKVKQGDKVKFSAENKGGALTLTRLETVN